MNQYLLQAGLCAALFFTGAVPLICAELLDLPLGLQLLLLWLMSVIIGNVLYYRIRSSLKSLIGLTHAYAMRHFDAPFPPIKWDVLGQLGIALQAMAHAISYNEQERFRRMRLESELSRFLRPTLAAKVAAGELALLPRGQRCMVSVVFVDLVGFNQFAETAPPTHVVALLQEVITITTELIFRHSGILDKSVGDCVMAVFGTPGLQRDHAQRAIAAAEDIRRFALACAPRWQRCYSFDVRLAIGISCGQAIVGDLGSETRLEYSAIGDVVTIAARLAALARPSQILLTKEVAADTPAGFDFNSLGEQSLFGQRSPLTVLELSCPGANPS